MRQPITSGKKLFIAAVSIIGFLAVNFQISAAADSSCVTCHLDKEMLKKNLTVQKGKKSAMQSGAG